MRQHEVKMSRIDVVSADKHKFKVMLNFIQRGVEYSNEATANGEAQKLHAEIPNSELHLLKV